MKRRTFVYSTLSGVFVRPLMAAVRLDNLESAADVLASATENGMVAAAVLYVRRGDAVFARPFGAATSVDDIFLIASISKPMSVAALMSLYADRQFGLDDAVSRFIPEFTGGRRDTVTVRHLLTHVSGLPDQLPENVMLRKRHAPLSEFVERAINTPLLFVPDSKYQYSSMGILLASEIARRISGIEFTRFIAKAVFEPLQMTRSALGLGPFALTDTMRCQVENAAPESGSGDSDARDWDWNSQFWRSLGAPWGGVHSSAADVARFLDTFTHPGGEIVKPETARLMVANHNRNGLTPRGLGFQIGRAAGSPTCSEQTFGHSGATGTLAWADPATDTTCVVLTTLPGRAVESHPRQLASDRVAAAVR